MREELKSNARQIRLERLTREIAQPRGKLRERSDTISAVLFAAGGASWAVESRHALGTQPLDHLTVLPAAPAFVRGITNHRGLLVPVLDLMGALGGAAPSQARPTWIMVLGDLDRPLALAADEAPTVQPIGRDSLLAISADVVPFPPEYFLGRTPYGTYFLDVPRLMADPRWTIDDSFE